MISLQDYMYVEKKSITMIYQVKERKWTFISFLVLSPLLKNHNKPVNT